MAKLFHLLILVLCLANNGIAALDAHQFFKPQKTVDIKLSPGGERFASIEIKDNVQQLVLTEIESMKRVTLIDLSQYFDNESQVSRIAWIDNVHIAAQFTKLVDGVKNLLDTKIKHQLLIFNVNGNKDSDITIYHVKTEGWLVDPLPAQENVFLYARSHLKSKIYKIDVTKLNKHRAKMTKLTRTDGGQFKANNRVMEVDGFASRWFLAEDKRPISVMTWDTDKNLSLKKITSDGQQVNLKTWTKKDLSSAQETKREKDKLLIPIARAGEQGLYYCLDYYEPTMRSLYEVDFEISKVRLVYQSPNHQIISLIYGSSQSSVIGVKVLTEGRIKNVYINKINTDKAKLTAASSNGEVESIIATSLSGHRKILYREAHHQSGQFFLLFDKKNKTKHVASIYPHLDGKLASKLIKGKVQVEKLEIPYLLTEPLPKKERAPLVVMPHGGPIGVFDGEHFDLVTQFFAAQGFAVLRVNFRGSGGYSQRYLEAGAGEWGRLMLEDIYQATLDATRRKSIDKNAICVFGMSYGGYAASMLAIKYPSLYKCAVSLAGVSDINLMLNSESLNRKQRAWLKKYVGDTKKDYDTLESLSPAYQIDKLKVPIFIIHGAKDKVVDVEHAYRFKLMLDKYEKNYQWEIFPDLAHDYGTTPQTIKLLSKITQFIKKNI